MLVLGLLGQPRDPAIVGEAQQSGWYHNSAAAIVEDGEVLAAVEEERLTRRKGTGKFPIEAVRFCLAASGRTLDDVDLVAFGEEGGDGPLRDATISREVIAQVLNDATDSRLSVDRVRLVEHHVAHAVSALAPSGFDSALVVTMDGFGDGISGTIWEAQDGHLQRRRRNIPFEKSLGRFYSSVLPFLAYGEDDEYKVMGLAPYGDPSSLRGFFSSLYQLTEGGDYELLTHNQTAVGELLADLGAPRVSGATFSPLHKDVAAGMQAAFEDIVGHVVNHQLLETGLKHLALAGGAAQNSTCVGRLMESCDVTGIYVQPAAHDAGIAIGAALAQEAHFGPRPSNRRAGAYLGPSIPSPPDISAELARWGPALAVSVDEDVCRTSAGLLASGAVVAWVQGRSEFGPRALGNRSILADPRLASNKSRINDAIKNREPHRPFAPAVLAEFAPTYFEVPHGFSSPYMTAVVTVRAQHRDRLAATTHIDGTARIQTVDELQNSLFTKLLRAFGAVTGVPVLLNTSFNSNGEPIVQSVSDAVTCFLTSGIDVLVIGDHIVRKPQHLSLASQMSELRCSLPPDGNLKETQDGNILARSGAVAASVSAALMQYLRGTEVSLTRFCQKQTCWGQAERDAFFAEIYRLWSLRLAQVTPLDVAIKDNS